MALGEGSYPVASTQARAPAAGAPSTSASARAGGVGSQTLSIAAWCAAMCADPRVHVSHVASALLACLLDVHQLRCAVSLWALAALVQARGRGVLAGGSLESARKVAHKWTAPGMETD